jgi:hypothetical protein
VILVIGLQVLSQMVDALRQQRDLDVRGPGVLLVRLELINRLGFGFHIFVSIEMTRHRRF